MNERIKELLTQATKEVWGNNDYNGAPEFEGYEVDQEKFAELVVRECAAHLKNCADAYNGSDADADYMEAMLHSAVMIKEHFGVE